MGAYSDSPDPLNIFKGLILRERRGSGSEAYVAWCKRPGVREGEDREGKVVSPPIGDSGPGSGGGREERRARR